MGPVTALQQSVATHYGYTLEELLGPRRNRTLAKARHVAMLLARQQGLSYPELGRAFRRDHSTVISGVRSVRRRLLAEPQLRREVRGITGHEVEV